MGKSLDELADVVTRRTSRRRFLEWVGKTGVGIAAALLGIESIGLARADSALGCCTGTGCAQAQCPPGSYKDTNYSWLCCPSGNCYKGRCWDCYNFDGSYNCTYMVNTVFPSCPCID